MRSALAVAVAGASCFAQAPRYTVTFLPNGELLTPHGMSRGGVVAGMQMAGGHAEAFSWGQSLHTFAAPGSSDGAWGYGASDSGWVVGEVNHGGYPRPFVADPQNGLRSFEPLGSPDGIAWSVNNSGVVVGSARSGAGGPWTPFVWTGAGGGRALPYPGNAVGGGAYSISSGGIVAGGYQVGDRMRPSRWVGAVFESLPLPAGYADGVGRFVNDAGTIVGSVSPSGDPFTTRGVVWSGGEVALLPDLGGEHTYPNAINSAGQIVGESSDGMGEYIAVTWIGGQIFRLSDLLEGAASAELVMARGVDEYGRIAAMGSVNGVWGAMILTPVPSPASCISLLVGGGIAATRRRRSAV